ncbi:MAG: glycogen synthase GlgA [Clostridia bacterium]|nr:glycogen synthase GlgA [Clostridia bacterium]
MKVLFVSSEACPFAKSGGLADVAGALPKALRKRMVGCRVVMPLYSSIKQELRDNMTFIGYTTVPVSWRNQYCGVFEAKSDGVIYYLLDNEYYFRRDGLYGHYDDAERFAFFSRAVLHALPLMSYKPDIIHCNDWQSAALPVYLNAFYRGDPLYSNIKVVYTIHNIQYQGKFGMEIAEDVYGFPENMNNVIEFDSCLNLTKAAIQSADRVTTVSPTYSMEILTPYYSYGLDRILKKCQDKLRGIVNGIDYDIYNPETDSFIPSNFSAENLKGKEVCKKKLREELGLEDSSTAPIISMVSRLVEHKGFDLVKAAFDDIMSQDVQIVVLGTGEYELERFFSEMANRYRGKVAVKLTFDEALAHRIYAGSDIFLMPSRSEPCGLSQLIALRYGTIPIVRKTGGLNDTVRDSGDKVGNGFTFGDYNAYELSRAVSRAREGYGDKSGWKILTTRAMTEDNSWKKSAGEYVKMYKEMML